jgi:predicted cupin superfamily sugar epimerase
MDLSGDDPAAGRALAAQLRLEPLPEEGGLFRQTWSSEHGTSIYLMLIYPDFSAMHRLASTEIYHFCAGAPLQMLLLRPGGVAEEITLGPDVAAGQRPQLVVPAGVWQGSSSTAAWTLAGCTMAPPFTWDDFQLGRAADLAAQWPSAAARICELTTPQIDV